MCVTKGKKNSVQRSYWFQEIVSCGCIAGYREYHIKSGSYLQVGVEQEFHEFLIVVDNYRLV